MQTPQSILSPDVVPALNARFDKSHPSEIIQWAVEKFGDRILMTSSFGADALCTIHLATQAKPDIKIVFIDTGFLFDETHQFMKEMRERFHLNVLQYRTR